MNDAAGRRRRWRFAAWLLALELPVGLVAQERPRFSASTEEVRLDVLVTDAGGPVSGLAADDFEVFDNGVRQRVRLMGAERMPINVTLVLDASHSVTGDRLSQLQAATRTVIAGLESADRAALLTFNHRVLLASPLTDDLALIGDRVQKIQPSGGTALLDAIFAGTLAGEADGGGRSLLIVFTDGSDTSSLLRHDAVLEIAKRTDVTLYAVVARLLGRRSGLEDIAQATGGSVRSVDGDDELVRTFARILSDFRRGYLLSYSPSGVEKKGWHRIEVRPRNRKLSVSCRSGYQVAD